MRAPLLARQNGWAKHLPVMGGKEPKTVDVFKEVDYIDFGWFTNDVSDEHSLCRCTGK